MNRVHMAMVVNKYGDTAGLILLEGIVKEVSLLCLFAQLYDLWLGKYIYNFLP